MKGLLMMLNLLRVKFLMLVAATLIPAGVYAQTSTYTGVVTVDDVTATPGSKVTAAIRLTNNNAQIAGMVIPLKFSSSGVTLDSVSYSGSILGIQFTKFDTVITAERRVRIAVIPDFFNVSEIPTVSGTGGLLATLHFTISSSAIPQLVSIDSVNEAEVIGPVIKSNRIEFSDKTGTRTLYPGYDAGSITVQSSTGTGDDQAIPYVFALNQNYPNPFNPATTLSYSVPTAGQVKLEIFNVLGQTVETLVHSRQGAGVYSVTFDATNHPSGVYFYRLSHAAGTDTRKMLLLK